MAPSVEDLLELCRAELGDVHLLHAPKLRANLGKTMFEIGHDGRRLIGKVSKTQNRVDTYGLMQRVWDAGMRPPSRFIITEPIAWFPERSLLLQSKAEGQNVLDLVRNRDPRALEAVELAAGWLHAMQSLVVDLPPAADLSPMLDRCINELQHPRAQALLEAIRSDLTPHSPVPAHGDFHPQNVFVSDDRLTTAIDLDTLCRHEPAFDVAWFLTQMASMGYHKMGRFSATAEHRKRFRVCAPTVSDDRVRLHVRFALIRSLHYDLCILKLKDHSHVEDFLDAAEHALGE
jgi:hypothetical protein